MSYGSVNKNYFRNAEKKQPMQLAQSGADGMCSRKRLRQLQAQGGMGGKVGKTNHSPV